MAGNAAFETNPAQWFADMKTLKSALGLTTLGFLAVKDEAMRAFAPLLTESDLLRIATGTSDDSGRVLSHLAAHFSTNQIETMLKAISGTHLNAGTANAVMAARFTLAREAPAQAMRLLKEPNLNTGVRAALIEALAGAAPQGYTPLQEDYAGLTPKEEALLKFAALRGSSNHAADSQSDTLAISVFNAAERLGPDGKAVMERVSRYFLEIRNQPEAVLLVGQAMKPGELRDGFITDAVAQWAQTDVVGASAALAASGPGTVPDSAISALISEIHADPDATFTWAMWIQDPARRASVIAAELKKLGRRDPAAASDWAGILRSELNEGEHTGP